MEDNKGNDINDLFGNFKKSMSDSSALMDTMLKNMLPQSTPKQVTIEVVLKKGFFGFGRKVVNYKADTFISMNSVLVIDFKDKTEMKLYFDSLK